MTPDETLQRLNKVARLRRLMSGPVTMETFEKANISYADGVLTTTQKGPNKKPKQEEPRAVWMREGWTLMFKDDTRTYPPADGTWISVKRERPGVAAGNAIMEDKIQFDAKMQRWYNEKGHCVDPTGVIAWKR